MKRNATQLRQSIEGDYDLLADRYKHVEGGKARIARKKKDILAEIEDLVRSRDELLEACESCLALLDDPDKTDALKRTVMIAERIRTAVTKAKGEGQ